MSTEAPKRLRDDPELLALTGLRFDDESATADILNVDAGRAALEATLSAGGTSVMGPTEWLATTTAKLGAGVAVTATIASIAFFSIGQGGPPLTEQPPVHSAPAVVETAASEADAPESEAVADAPSPVAEPVDAPPEQAPEEATPLPAEPAVEGKTATPKRRVAPKKRRAEVTLDQPKQATKAPEPTSTLPEQLALYEAGKKALAAGDHAGAIKAFDSYRATFPAGTLRREVGLSMLEALVRGGQVSRASRVAQRLLSSGGLGKRRAEVRRVLGEMQARLGRCDDAALTFATALQEGASGLTLTAVEAAVSRCRSRKEASP